MQFMSFLDVFDSSSFMAAAPTTPQTLKFPFKSLPQLSYKTGGRKFEADRAGGKRKHAGCDLIFPVGTPIFAMADGIVIQAPYTFYEHTDALEILHKDAGLIIRYGEMKPHSTPKELRKAGAPVLAGQMIGAVGQLVNNAGHASSNSMLHIEMYTDINTSPVGHGLTVKGAAGGGKQRRSDCVNPAPYLDAASNNLASGS